MADARAALHLVEEDAYAPRGGGGGVGLTGYMNFGAQSTDQLHDDRVLSDSMQDDERGFRGRGRSDSYSSTLPPYQSAAGSNSVLHGNTLDRDHLKRRGDDDGHDREDDDEDEDDDGMAWEPSMSMSDVHATSTGRRRGSRDVEYDAVPPTATTTTTTTTTTASSGPGRGAYIDLRRRGYASGGSESGGRSSGLTDLDKRTARALWWRTAMINCMFIAAWYTFSTCISVYNKWMFSAEHYDFPYPLFVTSCHMLMQWVLAGATLSIFSNLRPKTRPKPKDYLKSVAPCGVATGLDIGLSNLSLRSITLSFYTMCKSSSLAFVLLFAFLFKLEVPTWKLVGIIFIITSGVILMVSTETQFDFAGMVEVLTASAMGGLRWSLTQILLDKEALGMNNPIATLFWLAPVMGLTLATCSMIWDGWWTVFADERFFGSLWATLSTLLAVLFPGMLAFCMNVTEFGLIQRTSVVTLSVAGIFKEVGTIFLSMFIFHDQLTPINVSGLVVTILGIAMYNYLKYQQFLKDPEAASKGHGAGLRRHSRAQGDFSRPSSGAEESYDEDAPMLSNRDVARGGKDADAFSLATMPEGHANGAGPHHGLGSDDEDSLPSSPRSSLSSSKASRARRRQASVSLPSQPRNPFVDGPAHAVDPASSTLHLEAQTLQGKMHQHDDDRIPGLEQRLHDRTTEDGRRLLEIERQEKEFEHLLDGVPENGGNDGSRKDVDAGGWDLLGADDDEDEAIGGGSSRVPLSKDKND